MNETTNNCLLIITEEMTKTIIRNLNLSYLQNITQPKNLKNFSLKIVRGQIVKQQSQQRYSKFFSSIENRKVKTLQTYLKTVCVPKSFLRT